MTATDSASALTYEDLRGAVAAASELANPWDVVKALAECRYLEVLARAVHRRYQDFSDDLVHEAVSQAVDALVVRLRVGGQPVQHIDRYLLRTALNVASDLARDAYAAGLAGELPDIEARALEPRPIDHDTVVAALAEIRGLIPLTGGKNVQDVLSVIFDAAEAGIEELTSTEIGDRLDLSASTVRTCKRRGFARLAALGIEKGIVSEFLGAADLSGDTLEDEQ